LGRKKSEPISRILAYIVAGYPVGLAYWSPDEAGGDLVNRVPTSDAGSGVGKGCICACVVERDMFCEPEVAIFSNVGFRDCSLLKGRGS
jgi:hypothetical protein